MNPALWRGIDGAQQGATAEKHTFAVSCACAADPQFTESGVPKLVNSSTQRLWRKDSYSRRVQPGPYIDDLRFC